MRPGELEFLHLLLQTMTTGSCNYVHTVGMIQERIACIEKNKK